MNILYLDFDGVICNVFDFKKDAYIKDPLRSLNNERLWWLEHCLEEANQNAYIVSISSWADATDNIYSFEYFLCVECGFKHLHALRDPNNSTKSFYMKKGDFKQRPAFIKETNKLFNVKNYLILDDDLADAYSKDNLEFVQTDHQQGICFQNMFLIKDKIKNWK